MSITITINNNEKYVRENKPEEIEKRKIECYCVWHGQVDPTCPKCKGKGWDFYAFYPYEMNLANANFATLWNSLGLESKPWGELNPQVALKALARTPTALLVRENRFEDRVYHCGIHEDQANRYFASLKKIADEAEKREEKIIWG